MQIKEEIVAHRRRVHEIAETGLSLPLTCAYVAQELRKLGLQPVILDGDCGVTAVVYGELPGKTLALRADMDALNMREQTGLPFAAHNGNMHACGHDAHTAMLLGAAKLLAGSREALRGSVKLIFQVDEEGMEGARRLVELGVLENPHVDAMLAQHVGRLFDAPGSGQIGIRAGRLMTAHDRFVITVTGRSVHGSSPAEGIDAVVAAAHIVTALQTLVSRRIGAEDCAVVTIGMLRAGSAYNTIADAAELQGSIRSFDPEIRRKLTELLKTTAEGVASALGAEALVSFPFSCPATVNDARLVRITAHAAEKTLGSGHVTWLSGPVMGSEDVSYYFEHVPGCMYFVSTSPEGKDYPNHSSLFDIDENLLAPACAVLTQAAYDCMEALADGMPDD